MPFAVAVSIFPREQEDAFIELIAAGDEIGWQIRRSQVEWSRSGNPAMMKTALFVLLLMVLLFSRTSGDTPQPGAEPEYYYTRVMYTGVRTPERGGPIPARYPPVQNFKCSDLERGEGGLGGGWLTDYPASDCKFMWGVDRLTKVSAYREAPHPMDLMDPRIFDFPYLYI